MSYKLTLLKDKTRLDEIYRLRVKAWQKHGIITPEKYPNGFYDHLDVDALHWTIIINNKIVGAARLCILNDPDKLLYAKTFKRVVAFKKQAFFCFYSRLVVDPDHQGNKYSYLLDNARLNFIRDNKEIETVIAIAGKGRANKLAEYGFSILDEVRQTDDFVKMDDREEFVIQLKRSSLL